MAVPFARGRKAFGYCDRCGFRYDLGELSLQPVKGKSTELKVCTTCLDIDHPQLFLGMVPVNDPQALKNPRPDTGQTESRVLWGWNPVFNTAIYAISGLGTVTVNTNT